MNKNFVCLLATTNTQKFQNCSIKTMQSGFILCRKRIFNEVYIHLMIKFAHFIHLEAIDLLPKKRWTVLSLKSVHFSTISYTYS